MTLPPVKKSSGLTPEAKAGLERPPWLGNANVRLGRKLAKELGWSRLQWWAWYTLVRKESSWNNLAQNPRTTAFGLGQFLDQTWATVGAAKTSDPELQLRAMVAYIKQRYGGPCTALSFHISRGWY